MYNIKRVYKIYYYNESILKNRKCIMSRDDRYEIKSKFFWGQKSDCKLIIQNKIETLEIET